MKMSRHCRGSLVGSALRCIALAFAVAAAPVAFAAEPLLQSGQSWDGGAIAYPAGEPQITSVMLRIEDGEEPPFHCHPMPTMGYVLRGALEVETRTGEKAVFRQGDAVVELMRTVHRGRALEAPVEIIVFYAGASGLPTTVLPEQAIAAEHCDDV